jgi:photosystem II stability/assembly factor-like uncharacterized protein
VRLRRVLAILATIAAVSIPGNAARRRAVAPPPPPAGPCEVRGLADFYFTTDGGANWSRNAETPARSGAWEIITLDDDPSALVTVVAGNVFDSTDGGCSWTTRHVITEEIHHSIHLVPSSAGRAFIWTEDWALRYDHGEVITLIIPERIGGLGVDPANREHVRLLGVTTGKSIESFDGGNSWQDVGGSVGGAINGAAFDPTDFKRMFAGLQTVGLMVSRDGGRTWGLGTRMTRAICRVGIVPGHPEVIWLSVGSASGQPAIYRSTDGGAHIEGIAAVPGVETGVCMPLIVNPHNIDLAVTPYIKLHTFDATTKSVSSALCCGGRIASIAYSPVDPMRIYVHAPAQ